MQKKLHRLVLASLAVILGASCTTAYDAYGNPRPVVDPGTAVLGAAAVGLLAYGLGSSNNNRHHHHSSRYSGYGYGGYSGYGYPASYGYGRGPACYY
ncbi:hypothetical protein [Brevifollis gellanilyticus]|uniref:Lipoprotein n=1 Tax=Brevifollis gellanilyticus TaxID=748831 RepID=A0A512ME50_9BACT|nr:hypothetical protein [Brevifollis gellanilyticus]GEP44671.1 hypothetical protein BGE01nite_39620 [Brevifollis gellanilyticus]